MVWPGSRIRISAHRSRAGSEANRSKPFIPSSADRLLIPLLVAVNRLIGSLSDRFEAVRNRSLGGSVGSVLVGGGYVSCANSVRVWALLVPDLPSEISTEPSRSSRTMALLVTG